MNQLLILLALISQPTLEVTTPDKVVEGDKVILSVITEPSENINITWAAYSNVVDVLEPIEGGRRCVLASKKGTHVIFCAASDATGITSKVVVIKVTGVDDVEPEPDPYIPVTKFGLTKVSYIEGSKILSSNRRLEAVAIANSYKTIVKQFENKPNATPDDITTALRDYNRATLNADITNLWGGWALAVVQQLDKLALDNKLKTCKDYMEAYQEIADGLTLVK